MMWYLKTKIIIRFFVLVLVLVPGFCYSQESRNSELGTNWENSPQDYWPFPNPDSGYVSDHATLLGLKKEEEIERWLWQIESKTGVEIIVITINRKCRVLSTRNKTTFKTMGINITITNSTLFYLCQFYKAKTYLY